MACCACPMAACTYAAPLLMAAPGLYRKFEAASPRNKALVLVGIPLAIAALAFVFAPERVAYLSAGFQKCPEARNTMVGVAILYGYVVQRVASAPAAAPAAEGKEAAKCPFSGSTGDSGCCPASKATPTPAGG
mmetsp:Transcript_14089/g.41991  ORF Transcript_14089/g.41991 Transcript_14089/m.41991 type:complete len:133 (+) Transcript_14089:286-684(+)